MRVLPVILALSFLWQHALVATTQAVLCCQESPPVAAAADDTICRCVHGPGEACPMHHGSKAGASGGTAQPRWCAGCTEQSAVLLTGVSGDTGTPPQEPFRAIAPLLPSTVILDATTTPLDSSSPPALPPPRS